MSFNTSGIFNFLRFLNRAKTKYQLDSPFLHEFVEEVLEDKRNYYAFPLIESIRKSLLQNECHISYKDIGAPSKTLKKERSVKDIAKNTAISPRAGRYLFKIIHTYKPEIILELGTALGLSTMYQATAALGADIYSIEGVPELAEIAEKQIEEIGLPNVEIICGSFQKVLPELVEQLPFIDYVFIDGHHDKEARIKYLELILPKLDEQSVLVFSDIYWSKEMEEAWKWLIDKEEVSLSIDLFEMGLVFFRSEFHNKQHLKLVPAKWKFWKIGLFR